MKCAVKYANNKNGYISKWDREKKCITTDYIIDHAACFNSEYEALAELPPSFEYIFVNWKTVERKQKAKYIISVDGLERFILKRTRSKIRTCYNANMAMRFSTKHEAEQYISKLRPVDKTIKFYVVERSAYENHNQ